MHKFSGIAFALCSAVGPSRMENMTHARLFTD